MPIDSIQDVSNAAKSAVSQTAGAVSNTATKYSDVYTTVNDMVQAFWGRVPYLIISVSIFILFWLFAKLFKLVVRKTLGVRAQRKQNLVLVLSRLGGGLLMFVGFLIAMVVAIPGFTPGQLVGALGISSVAIGFAFKDIFQNFLSGVIILLSEPFRIGDQIVSGGFEGTVEDIQIRATYIKTYDGRRIVIPNAQLFTNPVQVNTAFELRRIQADIGIGYGDDIEHARHVMLEVLEQCDSVYRNAAPTVVVVELADSVIMIRVRWWIDTGTQMNVVSSTDQVLTAIKNRLTEEGIDLPFPTQQILFHNQTESGDGDRQQQREGWPARRNEHTPASTPPRNYSQDPSESAQPERD